jgi:hypothetical protein
MAVTHQGEGIGVFSSGKRVEVSASIMDRISGGKITENWDNWGGIMPMHELAARRSGKEEKDVGREQGVSTPRA